MDDLELFLAMIGVVFVLFSAIVFFTNNRSNETFKGIFGAIWILIAFGFGSWLISWVFMSALKTGFSILGWWCIFVPLIAACVIGMFNRHSKGKRGG